MEKERTAKRTGWESKEKITGKGRGKRK